MKTIVVCLMVIFCVIQHSEQLPNLLNTSTHECIECLCHARTGCYNRITCANYSISKTYWETAGYPTLPGDSPGSDASYRKCIRDENCILNTIVGYTSTFINVDCNCDGIFDCQDMLKLHVFGGQCGNIMDSNQVRRFNNCATMNNLSGMTSNKPCKVEAQ